MQRFKKDMGGAFKRLMSKKKIPPPPVRATQKKLIPTNTKGSNEDLYMLASSAFFLQAQLFKLS